MCVPKFIEGGKGFKKVLFYLFFICWQLQCLGPAKLWLGLAWLDCDKIIHKNNSQSLTRTTDCLVSAGYLIHNHTTFDIILVPNNKILLQALTDQNKAVVTDDVNGGEPQSQ